jgi:hypothetical protein
MGHNEFNYFADALVSPYRESAAVALARELRASLALYRSMETARRRVFPDPRRAYSPELYVKTPDHARTFRGVVSGYEGRVRQIAAIARSAGVTLLLNEPVSSGIWLPQARWSFHCYRSGIREGEVERTEAELARARQLEEAGRWPLALDAYRGIAAAHPGFPAADLGVAKALAALDDREGALEQSTRGKEGHPLPTVAGPQLIAVLERVAWETEAIFVGHAETFDEVYRRSPERYESLFLDDCHPNGEGHRLLAQRMLEALGEHGVVRRPPPDVAAPR